MNEQSLKQKLKNIAKTEVGTQKGVWKKLTLERFLARLSKSNYHDNFIFKGGLLLSHYLNIGRETKDIDFLVTLLNAKQPNIEQAMAEIAKVDVGDGFEFSYSDIELLNQPHMNYPGYRVCLDLRFGTMKDRIQVDIGVGDVVDPVEESIEPYKYKGTSIFEGAISLQVYPIETIFAEKLEAIISRGAANSRMKDFHDLVLIGRQPKLIDKVLLNKAVKETFHNRGTDITLPIQFQDAEHNTLGSYWSAHGSTMGTWWIDNKMPTDIKDAVSEINQFLSLIDIQGNI